MQKIRDTLPFIYSIIDIYLFIEWLVLFQEKKNAISYSLTQDHGAKKQICETTHLIPEDAQDTPPVSHFLSLNVLG